MKVISVRSPLMFACYYIPRQKQLKDRVDDVEVFLELPPPLDQRHKGRRYYEVFKIRHCKPANNCFISEQEDLLCSRKTAANGFH